MSDWFETLNGTYAKVWDCLSDNVNNRAQVAFATISPANIPEVRTVVLRHASKPKVEIYTDLKSDKITSLQANPIASILLWDADLALQIRLTTKVSILSGETIMTRWSAVPDHSKISYGIRPAPGQPIPDSTAYTKQPDPNAFAVLVCHVTDIDAVYLGQTHRRTNFSQDSDWRGKWLAP